MSSRLAASGSARAAAASSSARSWSSSAALARFSAASAFAAAPSPRRAELDRRVARRQGVGARRIGAAFSFSRQTAAPRSA